MLLLTSIRMLSGAAWAAPSGEEVAARDVLPAAAPCCPAVGPDTRTVPNIRPAAITNIGDRLSAAVKGLPPCSRCRSVAGGVGVLSELAVTHFNDPRVGGMPSLAMFDRPGAGASAVQADGSGACAQDCLEVSPVSRSGIAPHAISRTDPVTISQPSARIRHTRRMAITYRSRAAPECRVNRRPTGFV